MRGLSLQTRGTALLVVMALFAAQPVVIGLHHVLQPHYYCLVHSSFEHLVRGGEGGTIFGLVNAVTNAGLFNPSEDEHLICPISQQAQSHCRFLASNATQVERCCELAAMTTAELFPPTVPTLSYAPKHSPPPAEVMLSL